MFLKNILQAFLSPTRDYSHVFRVKKWWELALISGVMCGIEVCYSAETAFVSPLLLGLGINMSYMTMVWCISPLLGFFLTPIIGSLSDSCGWRFGRRRPFILFYSIGIIVGLILLPFGKDLGKLLGDGADSHPRAIALTVIGAVLLDFCCDACQSPARAFLLDVTVPRDHPRGLSYFTIMAGVGGFFGAVISAINWEKVTPFFNDQLHIIFISILVVFLILLAITLNSFTEIPRGMLNEVTAEASGNYTNMEPQDPEVEQHLTVGEYIQSIVVMPGSLWWLSATQLISWMSLLCYALYLTDFVGESVFGGSPKLDSPTHDLFQEGVQFGCWGIAVFCLTCSLYSLVIERLIKKFGARWIHAGGLGLNALAALGMVVLKSPAAVVALSSVVGIQYATMLTLPYIIVARYHERDTRYKGHRGLGTDIAIISSMVFLGQFLLSAGLGSLVKATATSDTIMYVKAFFSVVAIGVAQGVSYQDL